MTEWQMLVVAGAFLVAGLVKGAIGMGLPPTAVALMTLALPLGDAIAIMTIPTITTNIWQALYGGHFRPMLRRFWPMILSLLAGIFAIAAFGIKLGAPGTVGWLGVVLALYAVVALTAWRARVKRHQERWLNLLFGVISGGVAGVTGIAAVPFLPYMQSLEMQKDELVQALGVLFVCIMAGLVLALAQQGGFNTANLLGSVAANIPTFVGVWLGQKVRHAASPETFRRIFLFGMLAIGLHMAYGLL